MSLFDNTNPPSIMKVEVTLVSNPIRGPKGWRCLNVHLQFRVTEMPPGSLKGKMHRLEFYSLESALKFIDMIFKCF